MTGYSFELSCPKCRGELTHLTTGSRRAWQQAAMARCMACRREVLVNVDVSFAREEHPGVQEYRMAEAQRELRHVEHETAMARTRRALTVVR